MVAPGPRARLRPQPRPTPTRQANSCVKSPRKTARIRCPPASAWLTKRRRRSRRWRLRKKVKPGEAVGSPGWRAGRGRAQPLARAGGGAAEPSERLTVAGARLVPSQRRSQAQREPSRRGRTERAPRGRPGRSRRFLPGARLLLAQRAREQRGHCFLPGVLLAAAACCGLLPCHLVPQWRGPSRKGLGSEFSTWAESVFGALLRRVEGVAVCVPRVRFVLCPFALRLVVTVTYLA